MNPRGAGEFDKLVVILKRGTDALDGFGNPQLTWMPAFKRWARVMTMGGREYQQASTTVAEATLRLALRSDEQTRGISPADRIEIDGRTLEIVSAFDVDARRMEVVVDCKEVAA